jgi:hypothetical protein
LNLLNYFALTAIIGLLFYREFGEAECIHIATTLKKAPGPGRFVLDCLRFFTLTQ